ncbi:helix-turn-helix transcriptional regulator [Sphingobium chlorophenolicum]|uniref:Helix-turn-helix, type 11 domain protein n=1 Tax=Sphingobium chlorophenolicum TaxID=46429 RepID=A0A081REI1_SPHCR|nr:YafY family protein [Sphingobium chlorophenolicum]KEQ53604.1 Helix-turn-helix, type 11 domain protein [Sphingobium chlorophenolicum]
MRRADRLFQIIQILRRSSHPVTAGEMACELEVSQRTVYRDVADLIAQRVPIQGEPGFGYILDDAFDMPPLMLTPDEIEAAVLGAQWVAGRGDRDLANAARDLIAKITSVVPERLRPIIAYPASGTRPAKASAADRIDLARVREWIREGRKIQIEYLDQHGARTDRVVWPIILGFLDDTRMLAAWCELRRGFRHFRTDRIVAARFLDDRYDSRPAALRQRWKRDMEERRNSGPSA